MQAGAIRRGGIRDNVAGVVDVPVEGAGVDEADVTLLAAGIDITLPQAVGAIQLPSTSPLSLMAAALLGTPRSGPSTTTPLPRLTKPRLVSSPSRYATRERALR